MIAHFLKEVVEMDYYCSVKHGITQTFTLRLQAFPLVVAASGYLLLMQTLAMCPQEEGNEWFGRGSVCMAWEKEGGKERSVRKSLHPQLVPIAPFNHNNSFLQNLCLINSKKTKTREEKQF